MVLHDDGFLTDAVQVHADAVYLLVVLGERHAVRLRDGRYFEGYPRLRDAATLEFVSGGPMSNYEPFAIPVGSVIHEACSYYDGARWVDFARHEWSLFAATESVDDLDEVERRLAGSGVRYARGGIDPARVWVRRESLPDATATCTRT
jgi:hypothetical protein